MLARERAFTTRLLNYLSLRQESERGGSSVLVQTLRSHAARPGYLYKRFTSACFTSTTVQILTATLRGQTLPSSFATSGVPISSAGGSS